MWRAQLLAVTPQHILQQMKPEVSPECEPVGYIKLENNDLSFQVVFWQWPLMDRDLQIIALLAIRAFRTVIPVPLNRLRGIHPVVDDNCHIST